MKRALFLLPLLLVLAVNAEEKIDDQVVIISDQDKTMNTAITKARNTLPKFFEISEDKPEGADGFKLKVMVSDESGVEHLWFSPFKQVEGGYSGVLVNEPNIINSMSYGNVYTFKVSQISDWGYVLNGKQVGSYTVCALFLSMDKAVVEQYKNDHGFECKS